MVAQNIRRGVSIAREAIGSTGTGERTLYGFLLGGGIVFVIIGWHADSSKWTTAHPYLAGLLIGATGFCFGVPVAGLVIRDITRRASQNAERRSAARAITSQLDYLDSIVEGLSSGPILSASERLRKLADTAWSAMPRASASAKEMTGSAEIKFWMVTFGGSVSRLAMQPKIAESVAAELRDVVESNKLWASVGFSCGRLSGDIARLIPVLYSPAQPQQAFPSWLDELTSSLQRLLVFQLPVQRLWLLAAVKDPAVSVPVAMWSMQKEPPTWWVQGRRPPEEKKNLGVLGTKSVAKEEPYSMTPEGKRAAQERATNELRGEILALCNHLEALAALVDAAIKCRSELNSMEG